MVLSGQTIRKLCTKPKGDEGVYALKDLMISPFIATKTLYRGMSYGLSTAGYDIRIREDILVSPGGFSLASSIERFCMPADVMGIVHDKSTWARLGLAAQNTVIEPGWCGFLTLELTNHSDYDIHMISGMPITQVVFHKLDEPAEIPYNGKYMNQKEGAQGPVLEHEE